MNCQEVMELMQRQLDYDLNAREEERLKAHLQHCVDCALMFERLQRLQSELTNLPKVMPAYSLVDSILPKLNEIDLQAAATGGECTLSSNTAYTNTSLGSQQPAKLPWKRRFGLHISWKVAGGVVAAGLAIGTFIFDTENPISNQADGLLQPNQLEQSQVSQEEKADDDKWKAAAPTGVAPHSQPSSPSGDIPSVSMNSTSVSGSIVSPSVTDSNSGKSVGKVKSGSNMVQPSTQPIASQEPTMSESSSSNGSQGEGQAIESTDKASDATVEPSKPSEAPTERSLEIDAVGDKKQGIASTQPIHGEALHSPDGVYAAQIELQKVLILKAATNEIVYTSAFTWKETDQIKLVSWSEHQLTYQVTSEGKTQTFIIDAPGESETLKK